MQNIILSFLLAALVFPAQAQIPENLQTANRVDPSEVPAVYDFNRSYKLEAETAERNMVVQYLLEKDAPYFAVKMPEKNMHMVIDPAREMSVMYMDARGQKMMMAMGLPETTPGYGEQRSAAEEDFSFREIGSKTILGYECTGYQAENDEMKMTYYITSEADIAFTNFYRSRQAELPESFDPDWMADADGIMMQMIMENKKDPSENVKMTCIELEETSYSLRKSEYRTMPGY